MSCMHKMEHRGLKSTVPVGTLLRQSALAFGFAEVIRRIKKPRTSRDISTKQKDIFRIPPRAKARGLLRSRMTNWKLGIDWKLGFGLWVLEINFCPSEVAGSSPVSSSALTAYRSKHGSYTLQPEDDDLFFCKSCNRI